MKNKEETKKKLLAAVSQIFRTEGHNGLGVNKIARLAGVDKKLIYRYFGSFDQLVEAYVVETDYWMLLANSLSDPPVSDQAEDIKGLITELLQKQFLYIIDNIEVQHLHLWELNSKSDLMRSIHRTREMMGQRLLGMTDPHFRDTQVNFRAIAALLVGGIYYIILHSRNSGGVFTDVNVATDPGRREILSAIELIVDMAFEHGARP